MPHPISPVLPLLLLLHLLLESLLPLQPTSSPLWEHSAVAADVRIDSAHASVAAESSDSSLGAEVVEEARVVGSNLQDDDDAAGESCQDAEEDDAHAFAVVLEPSPESQTQEPHSQEQGFAFHSQSSYSPA